MAASVAKLISFFNAARLSLVIYTARASSINLCPKSFRASQARISSSISHNASLIAFKSAVSCPARLCRPNEHRGLRLEPIIHVEYFLAFLHQKCGLI